MPDATRQASASLETAEILEHQAQVFIGVGIGRLDGERAPVAGDGLLDAAHIAQCIAEKLVGAGDTGRQRGRRAQELQRLLRPAQLGQQVAQADVAAHVARVQAQCLAVHHFSCVQFALRMQRIAKVHLHLDVGGIHPGSYLQPCHGLERAASRDEQGTEINVS